MNVPRVVAIIIIGFMIVGLATFSFIGRTPVPTAPSADVPAVDASTTVSTSTLPPAASGTIKEGPVSPEPKVPLKPASSGATPANPQPGTAEPMSVPTSSPLSPTGSSSVKAAAAQPSAPQAQSFVIHANDGGADLKNVTVPKGTPVTITFNVSSTGTYYGGLDFRSSVVNTGTIAPGSSKAITFTAQSSFSFTPYWPASNIAKPYQIVVTIE